MTLTPGSRLGPYEILAPLGAGGMGEVWKAKDTRLDRFVAIKVLPEHLSAHPDALARFEREAKAVAALNHPNILAIHEFGNVEGTAYAVMELLEGESLRDRLVQGPLPPRKAVELAIQMAQGLAAAHERGVVHRDLKPENLWITKDGRLKILDFGLAKQVTRGTALNSLMPTEALKPDQTEKGAILGTVGYMSPEQVRGEPVDLRSDLFSFGVVLFEMLTGQRAFARATPSDTLAAILRDDPPDLEPASGSVPAGLQRVIQHCLEKDPGLRFHDAHDMAFSLESLSGGSNGTAPPPAAPAKSRRWFLPLVAMGAALLGGLCAWHLRRPRQEPSLTQLTFRRGNILQARFTSDGQEIVYAATWDGRPTELFLARLDGKENRPLGLAKAQLMAVNRQREVLILLMGDKWGVGGSGTLALSTLEGGTPRELLERVKSADFGPDGKELAVAHQPDPGGPWRLEFPLGKTVFESQPDTIKSVRISPKGDRVAFTVFDPRTEQNLLAVVDRTGMRRDLSRLPSGEDFTSPPVWSADGRTLYYCLRDGALKAVDLQARERVIRQDSSFIAIHDLSASGRALMERYIDQYATEARRDGRITNLSCAPITDLLAVRADGSQALLRLSGGLWGPASQVALRGTDGGPVKLLGNGLGGDLSSDGRWVQVMPGNSVGCLELRPTGPGAGRELRHPGWGSFLPVGFTLDGQNVLTLGRPPHQDYRLLRFPVAGGPAEVLPVLVPADGNSIFPDVEGRDLLCLDAQRRPTLRALDGSRTRVLGPALEEGESILAWDRKDQILVGKLNVSASLAVDLLDLRTGQRRPWQMVGPVDPSGVTNIYGFYASLDFKTLVYSYRRVITSDLFLMEGFE